MDTTRNSTKNPDRVPFGLLYSSTSDNSNRQPLAPIAIGKSNQSIIGEEPSHNPKSTFIYCDDQDENAGVNIDYSGRERAAAAKPTFYIGQNENENIAEADAHHRRNHHEDESEGGEVVSQIDDTSSICEDADDAPRRRTKDVHQQSLLLEETSVYENSSVDMESIILAAAAERTKSSFVLYEDEDENNAKDANDDVGGSSSILCVSMKSTTTTTTTVAAASSTATITSCDWASELSLRQHRRDIVVSCPDYAEDIEAYLRALETKRRPKSNYMRKQPEVGVEMRSILVDWLVDVAMEYDLSQETLHLAVQYTDRFLSIMAVRKEHFQLLGVTAMMIAAKYEEIYPPELQAFIYITDDTYKKREIIQMEHIILRTLDYNLSAPTAFIFLISYLKKSRAGQRCQNLAKYLCDLALMDYSFLAYLPSLIAASCTFLAHYMTDGIPQAAAAIRRDAFGYDAAEMYPCAEVLLTLLKQSGECQQRAIRDKYKDDKYCRVSLLEPPNSLPSPDSL